jgi:hypothetical protein
MRIDDDGEDEEEESEDQHRAQGIHVLGLSTHA